MGAVESVKICTFILPFFYTKTYRRVISHDTEEWSKLWRDTDFYLKNDMRNLVIFNASSEKSENLHFDGLRLSKVRNIWAKKNAEDLCCEKWFKVLKMK